MHVRVWAVDKMRINALKVIRSQKLNRVLWTGS